MILREATIKYSGRDPDKLPPKSAYRICISCDGCGRVRWVVFKNRNTLCRSCVRIGHKVTNETKEKISKGNKGKSSPLKGIPKLEKTKQKMRDNRPNFNGDKNPAWKGGEIILICKWCGNEFKVCQLFKNQKFCSNKCTGKWYSKNQNGSNNPNWKGGIANIRDHVLSERECIKMNKRFKGSEFHHIISDVGIYIPKELHRHIWHNMKNGSNMGEINVLAIQFINGGL